MSVLEYAIDVNKSVNEVLSLYDVIGTTIPVDFLPKEITSHFHDDNTDLLFITFSGSTSSEQTLNAVREIRDITNETLKPKIYYS